MRTVWFKRSGLLCLAGLLLLASGCDRQRPPGQIIRLDPAVAAHLADSLRRQAAVYVAEGLEVSLWASDTLAPDPIALAFDEQGRAYITRTNRQKHSEFDIRNHRDWMTRSIALQSVEDRRAFLHEEFAPERSAENTWLDDLNGDSLHDWRDLTVEKEQVYRIEDTSGDGVADLSQVFVEDFHDEVTDVAGAVLPFEGDVFVGVGPDLWRLRDTSGDGTADRKASISHGYNVHIGFGGHGMSGLIVGPDGRLYWSVGDIGFNVVDQEGRRWAYPNQGAILRANPDGSDFEVFAAGVRNTHEFVFDPYGNLISVDNDGDHPGEMERLVYLVDGSDSGWRTNWQYGKYTDADNNAYNVWMDEQMFVPRFEGQTALITPPMANYHSGPAGMAYNPGTALNEAWQDRFFVAEFTGSPARSHVYAFRLRPHGAGFEFVDEQQVSTGILATGLDFGPDGALYAADWLDGWDAKNKGRIWKLDVPGAAASPLRQETKTLLGEDFGGKTGEALSQLLRHPDMRVRQKAQFELAGRGARGAETLRAAARQTEHQLARVHGIWGLGQLIRKGAAGGDQLVPFLQDADPEIRAQAARILGDVRYAGAGDALIPLLQDLEARPRFFAAEALGRIAYGPAVQPILAMLEANDDEDVYLRHAGTLALARIGEAAPVVALADHPSRALRVAAVIVLHRLRDPGVARFLNDPDEYIATDAARAINDDRSIEAALPDLARVLGDGRFTNEALLRRAINANLRLGTAAHAENVAAYAARPDAPEALRVEALAVLGVWPKPSVLDRVDGVYRGPLERDAALARAALAPVVEPLLKGGSPAVKIAAAEAVGRLRYEPAAPTLLALLQRDASAEVRKAALEALHASGYAGREGAIQTALADRDQAVRMAALRLAPALSLPDARLAEMLASVLGRRSVEEQQSALAALGAAKSRPANAVLGKELDRLIAGTLRPELHLDLMEAVEAGRDDSLQARLAAFRQARSADAPVAAYGEVFYGGNPTLGRRIFYRHEAAQCARCHAVGNWGGDVGPNLEHVASTLSREQLVEALVDPGARVAPGFGTVTLTLQDGRTLSGIVRDEVDGTLVLQTGDGATRRLASTEITERRDAPSSMPPMGLLLSRRELRDVVAFLATLE